MAEAGQGSWWVLPGPFVSGMMMNKSGYQAYHEREAARLRRLIENATTPAIKARLIGEADAHERCAQGDEEDTDAMAEAS